jgi:hypothetical protein
MMYAVAARAMSSCIGVMSAYLGAKKDKNNF